MNELGKLLKELRGKKSLRQVAELTGLSHSYISDVEKGFSRTAKSPIKPSTETLKRLAEAYDYDYMKLLRVAGYVEENKNESPYSTELTNKDERDIAKRIESIKNDMEHGDGLAFDGEPMSDEAMESFMEAMEYVVNQTKRINKKYTPKKYRKDDLDE